MARKYKAKKRKSHVERIVYAGVGIPLGFYALKKGADVLPVVGKGAESLGRIGDGL